MAIFNQWQTRRLIRIDAADSCAKCGSDGKEHDIPVRYCAGSNFGFSGALACVNAPDVHKAADKLSIDSTAWIVHCLFNL